MSTIKRLIELRLSLNIGKSEMARRLNMTASTYGSIESAPKGLSLESIEKIGKSFPNLNMRWLIMGDGKMWDYEDSEKNYENSEAGESAAPYGRLKEVTLYIEKECALTGAKCAFAKMPELEEENRLLRARLELLEKKK